MKFNGPVSKGTQVIVEPSMIIISVGFTAAIGIFFGYYPAKKGFST